MYVLYSLKYVTQASVGCNTHNDWVFGLHLKNSNPLMNSTDTWACVCMCDCVYYCKALELEFGL